MIIITQLPPPETPRLSCCVSPFVNARPLMCNQPTSSRLIPALIQSRQHITFSLIPYNTLNYIVFIITKSRPVFYCKLQGKRSLNQVN